MEATPIQGAPPRRIEEALEMADGWIARGASEKALALLRELGALHRRTSEPRLR